MVKIQPKYGQNTAKILSQYSQNIVKIDQNIFTIHCYQTDFTLIFPSYNPKWLAILKSTNSLQSSSQNSQHMPGPGYDLGRSDYSPTEEELKIIESIFNGDFSIPQNFKTTAKVFDETQDNIKQMFRLPNPQAEINPQTDEFCEKLGIDDPISLIDQEASLKASDFTIENDEITFQGTKNEDEIELDEDSEDESEITTTKRSVLNLPKPENPEIQDEITTKKSFLSLPPPKNQQVQDEVPQKRPIDQVQNEAKEETKEKSPEKKVLKRRNAAIYATNDD